MKKIMISAILCGLVMSYNIAQADFLDKAGDFIDKAKDTRDAVQSSDETASKYKQQQIANLRSEKRAKLKEINNQIAAKEKQINTIKKSKISYLEQKKQTDKLEWEIASLEKKADIIEKSYDKRIQNLQK